MPRPRSFCRLPFLRSHSWLPHLQGLNASLADVRFTPERAAISRCPRLRMARSRNYPMLQKSLMVLANSDSVALIRFAAESGDDGAAQSRPSSVVLLVLS